MFSYLIKFGVQRSLMLHALHQISSLTFIGSDNADLLWFNSRFQKARSNFLNVRCFRPIKVRRPRACNFFLAQRDVKEPNVYM